MGRLNGASQNQRLTTNHAGAEAYRLMSPEAELYARTATSFLVPKFYEASNKASYGYSNTENQIYKITEIANQCNPDFIAHLAAYLRNEMNLRSVSFVLVAHLALIGKLNKKLVPIVAQRADDVKEILAACRFLKLGAGFKKLPKLPNALKKGIALAFSFRYINNKLIIRSDYDFRKYNRGGKEEITFLDVMRLTHPKPYSPEQSLTFKNIKNDTLPPIETWETAISAAGPDPEAKKKAWEKLILEDKIGYMALLRNIRNIQEAGVFTELQKKVQKRIKDPLYVKSSQQLPFRYYSAYKALSKREHTDKYYLQTPHYYEALSQALSHSIGNIDGLSVFKDKKVFVACDVSGSMDHPLYQMSDMTLKEVATVMSCALARHLDECALEIFATDRLRFSAPDPFIFTTIDQILSAYVGGSTDAHRVLRNLVFKDKNMYDYVLFFTDCQLWSTSQFVFYGNEFKDNWNKYKQINPKAQMIIFDLVGYGTSPIDTVRPDVHIVSGWSDKVFAVLNELLNNRDVVSMIKKYPLRGID